MRRAAISVVLLFVMVELGLRLILGLGNPVVYQSDPSCGYLPAPNQHVRRFFARNDINSFGMRSPQIRREKPPGTLRILFLGDSVTYGTTFVDQSRIFTALLGPELRDRLHRDVEVLNASAGAWAIGNELGYLESRGTLGSDVVIFVLNTGDFTQPFNHQPLVANTSYPDRKPVLAIEELWARYLRPRITGVPVALDAGSTPSPSSAAADIDTNLHRLEEAREFVTTAGSRLAIVYSPIIGPGWDGPIVRQAREQYHRWASDEHVEFLDLTTTYAAFPAEQVYRDGVHLSPKGNELVARAIADDWPAISGTPGGQR